LLASCSADKSVRLYSYNTINSKESSDPEFRHITTIPTGHSKTVRALAWAPSGKTLATASFDSNIGIWEQEASSDGEGEGGEWECASLLEGHETECKSVSYSSSGTLLASCSRDKTVWVWEGLFCLIVADLIHEYCFTVHPDSDFECMGLLAEHTQDVKCVAWHPTEEILASASYDDSIKLYIDDPSEDWFCFTTLTGHTSTVWSICFAPSGNYLASASDDSTVRIWKRVSEHQWECVSVLEGHERSVYSVSWGTGKGVVDGGLGWVASTGSDGRLNVWELSVRFSLLSTKNLFIRFLIVMSLLYQTGTAALISACTANTQVDRTADFSTRCK
jgi:WD40 repeat protein